MHRELGRISASRGSLVFRCSRRLRKGPSFDATMSKVSLRESCLWALVLHFFWKP